MQRDLGTEHLRLERRGPLGWCTIDRPCARNAMTPAMYRGLRAAVQTTAEDPDLHALVITGTGHVFVPGGDMAPDSTAEPSPPSDTLPFAALRNAPIPVVTAVNGICQASGVTITLLADIAVASERATFRVPELLRGFADTWLAAVLPAHVGLGRARELAMTGRTIDAGEAHAIGIVHRVVAHEALEEAATRAALDLLDAAPHAFATWKVAANARYGTVDENTLDAMPGSPEVTEGFDAFLAKRPPAWSARGY